MMESIALAALLVVLLGAIGVQYYITFVPALFYIRNPDVIPYVFWPGLRKTGTDLFLWAFDVKDVFIPHAHLEQLTGPNQITQLLVPVVHRGEGAVIGNVLTHLAEMRPTIVISSLFYRRSKSSHQDGVAMIGRVRMLSPTTVSTDITLA